MKLMIDIDEDIYTRLFDNGTEEEAFDVNADDLCKILSSVRKGVPIDFAVDENESEYEVIAYLKQKEVNCNGKEERALS